MTITTWEEAASAAANTLDMDDFLVEFVGDLDSLDEYITRLHADTEHVDEAAFCVIAEDGVGGYVDQLEAREADLHAVAQNAISHVVDTIISKQHDYGHDNILWGGVDGLLLRLHDKVARIKNLQKRDDGHANESLADSWLDIAGYGLIGIMLANGTFELPLARDVMVPALDPEWNVTAIDPEYDEITDPNAWHYETENAHVAVWVHEDGFSDGQPRVVIGTNGKVFPDEWMRCTYFTLQQLSDLVGYLMAAGVYLGGREVVVAP